jgi:AcrR family transcriptional regulator
MDTRRAVLDAAIEMAASGGPDSVSMREVARRAGLSHQAPYHHFVDRSGIFAAITAEGFDLLAARLEASLDGGERPSRRCFEAYVRTALEHPGHFRVMFRSDVCGVLTHDDAARAADRAYEGLQEMVRRTIGRADARATAAWSSLMWSVAHGFATLLLDGPLVSRLDPAVDPDAHLEDVVGLMTEMVDRQAAAMGLVAGR